jgi:hypothetical protein
MIDASAKKISSGTARTITKANSLMRVRIVNLLGPAPASRVLRVTGRLGTALRDRLERATCRVKESILRTAVVGRYSMFKVKGG